MSNARKSLRFLAVAGLLMLAACGGGGGGGSFTPMATTTTTTTTTTTPVTPTVPAVTIGPASLIATSATPLTASSTTPTLHALRPGFVFPVTESVLQLSNVSIVDVNGGAATLTVLGGKTSTGYDPAASGTTVFLLTVPGVPLGSAVNLPGDGTVITFSDGAQGWLNEGALNYTAAGSWDYHTPSGDVYYGTLVNGFQTPPGGVPATGSATYVSAGTAATGSVRGSIWVPTGAGGVVVAGVSGQANIGVNFATGGVSGALTSMNATSTANGGNTVTPWNSVVLSGGLSGTSMSGNTYATATPDGAGIYGFSGTATGTFKGALYGPNGEELGAVWTLNEPNATNGKTAAGTITATKQ